MEGWQASYDRMLANPPEEDSKFHCDHCGEPIFPEERYYDVEGEYLCRECALEWLEDQYRFATEEQCYGE